MNVAVSTCFICILHCIVSFVALGIVPNGLRGSELTSVSEGQMAAAKMHLYFPIFLVDEEAVSPQSWPLCWHGCSRLLSHQPERAAGPRNDHHHRTRDLHPQRFPYQ